MFFFLLYSMNLGPSCNSKSSLFLATQHSRTVIIHLITLGRRIQLGTVHYLWLLSREIKTSDVLHFYHQTPVTFWCYECEFSFSKPKTNLCQHDYCHLSLQHFELILVSYESGQFEVLFFFCEFQVLWLEGKFFSKSKFISLTCDQAEF